MTFTTKQKKKTAPREKSTKDRQNCFFEFKNVDPAAEIALYFGFSPLSAPLAVTKEDKERVKTLGETEKNRCSCPLLPALEEKVALMRYYSDKKLDEAPQPVMLCAELGQGGIGTRKKVAEKHLSLEIIGSGKSIADATLIQTIVSILRSEGHKDLCVCINSVGDKDSGNRFVRELTNHYRKNIASLPQTCKTTFKRNPVELLECSHEKCKLLASEAPKPVGFLGEDSRHHFKEVLEYLEELEIPYQLDPFLVGNRSFATETIFEVRAVNGLELGEVLAMGCRYNHLGKRLGLKREAPSVGATILLRRANDKMSQARLKFKKPSVFFLQLGFEAKLKSLKVIETLRQAKIPLYQALCRDKLISQLSAAENLKIPYSIIMGQREALENSVIVRNTSSRVQETVKIADLPAHFKRLKLT